MKIYSKKASIAEAMGRSRDDRKFIDRAIQSGEIIQAELESGERCYMIRKEMMENLILEMSEKLDIMSKRVEDTDRIEKELEESKESFANLNDQYIELEEKEQSSRNKLEEICAKFNISTASDFMGS